MLLGTEQGLVSIPELLLEEWATRKILLCKQSTWGSLMSWQKEERKCSSWWGQDCAVYAMAFLAFSALSAFWRTFELKKPNRTKVAPWHVRGTYWTRGSWCKWWTSPSISQVHGLLSDHERWDYKGSTRQFLVSAYQLRETTYSRLKLSDIRILATIIPVNSKWLCGLFPAKASLCFVCVLNIFNTEVTTP